MESVEMTGKTVDEAIANALDELGLDLKDVKVEILQEASRGGDSESTQAKVRVSEKVVTKSGEEARKFLKELLSKMGISADVTLTETNNQIKLDIRKTPHDAILIGYRGKTLNSLQYLVNQVANKRTAADTERTDIEVDIQDYRERHRKMLTRMVNEAMDKVDLTGTPVDLEPMSAYDRKFIHNLVQKEPDISSFSVGEGQDRHIVISRKSDDVPQASETEVLEEGREKSEEGV